MTTLHAGTARVDITPNLGCHLVGSFFDRVADFIHDPLYVRALVLQAGGTTVGLITCDLIGVPSALVEAVKEAVTDRTGVPGDHVLISATHTHTAPSVKGALGTPQECVYAQRLVPKIADAFCMAHAQLQPAELAHASGCCSSEVHNRRWHMKDGSVRMNPGFENPEAVEPAGPTDPELGLLLVRRVGTRAPLAVYANYALHYVGGGVNTAVSADYFGAFERALHRIAGTECLVMMSNGCQGNINNLDFSRPRRTSAYPYQQMERVANVVAAESWKVWNVLREEAFRHDVTLASMIIDVPFKARCPSAKALADATTFYSTQARPDDREWIYARELVLMQAQPSEWDVPLQVMRIGDLGLVGLPGEVFVEAGLSIKASSPFERTLVVGLANGTVGYVSTDQALDEGSYETRLCRHVRAPRGTAGLWQETVRQGLEDLHRQAGQRD